MTHFAKQQSAEEIKLLVVSRVHMKSATTMPNPANVLNFILRVQEYASHILICVGADSVRDTEQYIQSAEALLEKFADKDKFLNHTQVTFLPVFPWGYFTTPLNAAVQFAQDKGFKYIVFQSIEFRIPKLDILELIKLHEERSNLLVVGPEMDGHEFLEGPSNVVRGRTIPWNTLAIWKVGFLALTGFPLIGDGTAVAREIGGVEEVSTINLLQLVNPQLQAILMKSKDERPASQMKVLGIASGTVIHLTVTV
eukprot:gene29865-39030_t